MEDQQIIALYWERCGDAIARSKEKYGAYCFTIAEHILGNAEDSETRAGAIGVCLSPYVAGAGRGHLSPPIFLHRIHRRDCHRIRNDS